MPTREPVNVGPIDRTPLPTASSILAAQLDMGRRFFRGQIVDYFSYLNLYSIARSQQATIYGTSMGTPCADHFGVRSGTVYSPGTEVLCLLDYTSDFCFILGTIPTEQTFPGLLVSDWILPHSGVTILEDTLHDHVLTDNGAKVVNANSGRPYDSLAGDYSLLNPFGAGLHIGLIEAFLRTGDDTGLWMFKHNGLMRLAARKLQQWTPGLELESGDDEGELYEIEERCVYPWESLGLRAPGSALTETDPTRVYDPRFGIDPNWVEGSHKAKYEPRFPDQRMAPRYVRMRGYQGDLDREIVCAPSPSLDVDRYSVESPSIGLSEVFRGSDGAIDIRSRRRIAIEKTVFIPVPRRSKLASDPGGDTAERGEYKASGHFGEGEDHDRTIPELPDPRMDVANMPDQLALERSKLSMLGVKSRRDFAVPAESSTHGHDGVSVDDGVHTTGAQFRAPAPSFSEIAVDHREGGDRKFFKGKAGIYITDDGKVVIEDAWGSQLVMGNGNITISCAGDVVMATGRNVVALAPNDICLRAGHSADISAGTGDLRLKAERNLHALAGNGGTGGALIESRGAGLTQDFRGKLGEDVQSSGVVLKATEGAVACYGQTVYLRSTDRGDVILDGDAGRGQVHRYALNTLDIVRSSQSVLFGVTPESSGAPTAVEHHDGSNVSFGQAGTIGLRGSLLAGGNGTFNRSLTGRSVSSQSGGEMGRWDPTTGNVITTALSQFSTQNTTTAARASEPKTGTHPYVEGGYGTETIVSSIGFSFRTDEQYGINFADDDQPAMFLSEARWQQGLRRTGATQAWVEPTVTAPGNSVITMPFPGAQNWTVETLYASLDLQHWDPITGDDHDLADFSPDETPSVTRKTLETGYVIKHQST